MDSGSGSKGREKIARNAVATRLSHLRNARFETAGFASNAPTPTVEAARAMAAYNARLIAGQRPQPSVAG